MKPTILIALCAFLLNALPAHAQTQINTNTGPLVITVNGTTYSLGTNAIIATMIHGQGDKAFEVPLHGKGLYGFSVYGYGVNFPTYGIIPDTASGGVLDNCTLRLHFNDSYLVPDGDKPRTYVGYIPIHVYQGSETGFDTNFLHLPVTLTVYPPPPKK